MTLHSRHRILTAALAALALTVPAAPLALADGGEPPPKFGTDSDDPRTPEPSIRPAGAPTCSIEILSHGFADYSVQTREFDIPAECGTSWSTAVLHLDGNVAGVQFDRIGWAKINDANVFRFSTPEPSAEGITWEVDQDVTAYQDVFRPEGNTISVYLGNTVNDTYTGVLDTTFTLDLWAGNPGQDVPDEVVTLADEHNEDGDLVGSVTMPRNSTKIVAQVYATGSGGGCEEFWDTSAPPETGYWCGDGMPYREVQVLIDGDLAGTALPYAVVYTGGWSNPYMWMPNPSPWAFDIPALEFDLTPFAGRLNDGAAHEVTIHVVGRPEGDSGWALMPNLLAWTDDRAEVIEGAVTQVGTDALVRDEEFTGAPGEAGSTWHDNTQRVTTAGWLDLPQGRTYTTVDRDLRHVNDRSWSAGEYFDEIDETSTDTQTVTTRGEQGPAHRLTTTVEWTKAGYSEFADVPDRPGALDIFTDLDISHASTTEIAKVNPQGRVNVSSEVTDTYAYTGWGDWTAGIPRAERVATSESTASFTTTDKHGKVKYEDVLRAINGYYVQ